MSEQTIRVHLPDGSEKEVPAGSNAGDVAAAIGPGLAKAAVAAVADGEVIDLMRPLEDGAQLRILTDRDPEALGVLRHSTAHVLATAVRALRPEAGIGFGPAIDEGFYYDFDVDEPFTPEDLEAFEAEMQKVVEADQPFERRRVTRAEARELFSDDPLKLERLEEFDEDEVITVYRNGPFLDLCRGPHVPSTGRIKNFRLLSAAGAYWRGDEHRQMLQRIYGTTFFKSSQLEEHLHRLEEAKKRDHRTPGARAGPVQQRQPRGAGAHPLASQGRRRAHGDRELRARADPAPRLRSGLHAPHHERAALRDLRAPGELRREHVRGHGGGGRRATGPSP